MKLEKKIRILDRKMDLKSIFAMYSELKLNINSISLKNLSIEFMILNNISFELFNMAIDKFVSNLKNNKEFTIEENVLTFKIIKKVRIPNIAKTANSNRLQAIFFTDVTLNTRIIDLIIEKLNKGIAIEITEGLFIVKSNKELKVIFGERFLIQG